MAVAGRQHDAMMAGRKAPAGASADTCPQWHTYLHPGVQLEAPMLGY
jgi:hypothetical protein